MSNRPPDGDLLQHESLKAEGLEKQYSTVASVPQKLSAPIPQSPQPQDRGHFFRSIVAIAWAECG
jgi:hypothetical protein